MSKKRVDLDSLSSSMFLNNIQLDIKLFLACDRHPFKVLMFISSVTAVYTLNTFKYFLGTVGVMSGLYEKKQTNTFLEY